MEFAREEIRSEQKLMSEKYNFDFETDTPLPGNFVYEPIDDVPECLKQQSGSHKKRPREDAAQSKITEFIRVTKPSTTSIVSKLSLRKRRNTSDKNDMSENCPVSSSPFEVKDLQRSEDSRPLAKSPRLDHA